MGLINCIVKVPYFSYRLHIASTTADVIRIYRVISLDSCPHPISKKDSMDFYLNNRLS